MKSRLDEISEDILGRKRSNPDLFGGDPRENIKRLAEIIQTVNLAKCSLFDLETEEPGAIMYLTYLLQQEGIPFGVCQNVRVFYKNKIIIKCLGGSNCPCKGKYVVFR